MGSQGGYRSYFKQRSTVSVWHKQTDNSRLHQPVQIKSSSLSVASALLTASILAAGWLWARLLISMYQRKEGLLCIGFLPRSRHYELWGFSVPFYSTGLVLLLCAIFSLVVLWRRREIEDWISVGCPDARTWSAMKASSGRRRTLS